MTQSASSSNRKALTGSGLRNSKSSDDSNTESEAEDQETRTRKLLTAYKKQMIKVRRIKSRSNNSATMYGRIRYISNKKERFVADSGTGIPIIPIEIVEDHGLKWEKVDADEPGCESASGHDMEVVGQCAFWVKFDNMKHPKLIKGLVAEQAGQELSLIHI